ncbi:MAG TPA: hypothetical protein ENF81_08945 [Thermotogaceae bacterium]|nr:hypothetical protein [Thermotogaceae bacterium]
MKDDEALKVFYKLKEKEKRMIERIQKERLNIQEIIDTFQVPSIQAFTLFIEAFKVDRSNELLTEEEELIQEAKSTHPEAKIVYSVNYESLKRFLIFEINGVTYCRELDDLITWSSKWLEKSKNKMVESKVKGRDESESQEIKSSLRAQGAKNRPTK